MDDFQLGNWRVTPVLNQLTRPGDDQTVVVTPKIMQLLTKLSEQKRQSGATPLSIDELISSVWAERVVSDSSVYQAVAQLRKVLNQDPEVEQYIERISGQGYRITPDIEVTCTAPAKNSEPQSPSNKTNNPFFRYATLLLIASIFIVLVVWLNTAKEQQDPFFESLSLAEYLIEQPQTEQLHQAKQLYLDVLEQQPDNVESLIGLCNSYHLLAIYDTLSEQDRDTLCQPLLQRAYEVAPSNSRVMAALARQAVELGNLQQAEQWFLASMASSDKDPVVWHSYGRLKRQQNKVEEALQAHKKAFQLAPNDPIVLRGLAYAYLNNRDLSNARKYYERSLVITPRFKNRPLFDLDFYPLNRTRASHYLAWYRQYGESHVAKYPSHQLSYILFLLSLGQGELAQANFDKLTKTQLQRAPIHFQLYVQAALSWYRKEPQQSLAMLAKRYQLAPEHNQFAMPYIMAQLGLGQVSQALLLFNKHFAELEQTDITAENLGQQLLLARLLKLNDQQLGYQKSYSKLLQYRQSHGEFTPALELRWQRLIESNEGPSKQLIEMLKQGWLPDYNDSIFEQSDYLTLLTSPEQKQNWQRQLKFVQACLWQTAKPDNCDLTHRGED